MKQELTRTTRALCRTRIVLYKLTVIAAINLLPLLTWHNATMHFFEEYHMDERVTYALKEEQLGGVETLMWVVVWILVPVDIVYALWCLGRYQEVLRPRLRSFESVDDITSSNSSTHDATTNGSTQRFRRLDHVLQVILSKHGRFILSLFYDLILVLVLATHVYVFVSLRAPSRAICDAVDPELHSQRNISHVANKFSDHNKCERYNWNVSAAGYSSSGMAGLLGSFHVGTVLCTLVEVVYSWIWNGDGKGDDTNSCKDAPRYVDIRTRTVGSSRTTGRLTAISEEEYGAGSGTSTRRRTNRSNRSDGQQSKASSGVSSRLEEVLLECLVE